MLQIYTLVKMCLMKTRAKFQPDQPPTFRFMIQALQILFCQFKIQILQNGPAHKILVLRYQKWFQ